MAKKKSSTAALVEHNVADEEHPERLPLEETWPAETQPLDEDDGTEPFGSISEYRDAVDALGKESEQAESLTIGLSSTGAFIAPAPASEVQASAPAAKKAKLTVASMTREQAFSTFRDKLFELCFKYGFTLLATGQCEVKAHDIGETKGTAKRALAVGTHIPGLELHK